MSEHNTPENPMAGLAEAARETRDERSKLDKFLETVVSLHEPTRVSDVADGEEFSERFARNKLHTFEEVGLVTKVSDTPLTYRRNETHFRRLRTEKLISDYDGDIDRAIADYQSRDEEYKQMFGVDSPDFVSLEWFDQFDDPEKLAEMKEEFATWTTIRRRLTDLHRFDAVGARDTGKESRSFSTDTALETLHNI
ncbi:DUF7342 family protein [Salinibaculum salinum]|uniref:DUF7342 family protein n=1 Tax=Salinibaculum salinum TaxID=3131996 RepID=UPI0030EDCAAE